MPFGLLSPWALWLLDPGEFKRGGELVMRLPQTSVSRRQTGLHRVIVGHRGNVFKLSQPRSEAVQFEDAFRDFKKVVQKRFKLFKKCIFILF